MAIMQWVVSYRVKLLYKKPFTTMIRYHIALRHTILPSYLQQWIVLYPIYHHIMHYHYPVLYCLLCDTLPYSVIQFTLVYNPLKLYHILHFHVLCDVLLCFLLPYTVLLLTVSCAVLLFCQVWDVRSGRCIHTLTGHQVSGRVKWTKRKGWDD